MTLVSSSTVGKLQIPKACVVSVLRLLPNHKGPMFAAGVQEFATSTALGTSYDMEAGAPSPAALPLPAEPS